MKTVLTLLSLFLVCGCEISVSKAPVGEQPLNIAAEKAEWEGLWLMRGTGDDQAVPAYVRVPDATNGILKVSVTDAEKESGDGLKQITYTVFLRKAGDSTLASVEVKDDNEETNKVPVYAWGRLKKSQRTACLWWASKKALDPLVDAGKLPAYEADKRDVLGVFGPGHVAQITCETNGVLFLWEEPLFFTRP